MNKKAQSEFFILIFEFIVIFWVMGALGAALYPMTYDIPLGAVFRILLPSPESVALDFLKQFIWAVLGTGGTAAAVFG
jgi:hypothetical protein